MFCAGVLLRSLREYYLLSRGDPSPEVRRRRRHLRCFLSTNTAIHEAIGIPAYRFARFIKLICDPSRDQERHFRRIFYEEYEEKIP